MEYFSSTQRRLKRATATGNAGISFVLTITCAAWLAWMGSGEVPLYVVSQQARLEVQQLPVTVQASVDGQVAFTDVRLGRVVERHDVILKLDTKSFELQRAGVEIALNAGIRALSALHAQFSAEQTARDAVARVADQTSKTANARVSLDGKSLEFKQKEREVVDHLREAEVVSGLDALHAAAGTETQRAQLATTSAQAALDTMSGTMNLRDREARLAGVRYTIAQAEAEIEALKVKARTLDYEIERRTVVAAVSGTLVDVMPISLGMTITSQQRLATILPEGTVRGVAFFAPHESLGRVRVGQPVTLRMDNFPWTQFGTLGGVVEQVGREPRDGSIRVELRIAQTAANIPIEHGLTALCEVEVERLSPFRLLLRSAGQWAGASAKPAPAPRIPTAGP